MSASSESALRASAIIIGYSFAISWVLAIVCAPPLRTTSRAAPRRPAPHGDLFWTYYYGKRLTRQSHGQRVVVINTRSAVANRDAPHPAGIAQLPLKRCPTRRVAPIPRRWYRAEKHMNFRLRRAAAAAAFGACLFGRARAHLPEPASWPRASRSVYVRPPRPLSLTIGSKKTSSCSCLAASRRMLPPCDGSSRAAASPGAPPWAAAPRRWACCIGS